MAPKSRGTCDKFYSSLPAIPFFAQSERSSLFTESLRREDSCSINVHQRPDQSVHCVYISGEVDGFSVNTNHCIRENSFSTLCDVGKIHENRSYAVSTTGNVGFVVKVVKVSVVFLTVLISQHLKVFSILCHHKV